MRAKAAISLVFLLALAATPGLCAEPDQTSPWRIQKAGMRAEWKVKAEYPDFNVPDIDNHIQAWLTAHVFVLMDRFKDIADAADPETLLTISITYGIAAESPTAVGILFNASTDLNHAAHPSTTLISLNFSKKGMLLSLDSLFADPERALVIFAEQAPKLLPANFPNREDELEGLDDWIAKGTAPILENYSCYIVEPDGIRIFFQQYQVVPYYMGMPDVLIPLAVLQPAGPNAEVWPPPDSGSASDENEAATTDLMHFAAAAGHVKAMMWLKEKGATVDAKDSNGHTPMHRAANNGHVKAMVWLKENGAEVNAGAGWGITPMDMAARGGHVEAMAWLKENGAKIDAESGEGFTLMHTAANYGHVEVMAWLKENGAEVNAKDDIGWTPMHRAANNGHVEAMVWLKENGAEVGAKGSSTTMHLFAPYGRIEVMAWLRDNGAEVDSKDDNGATPMHFAAMYGHLETMMWLKENGAEVDVKDERGVTPMHWASQAGRVEAMAWLKDNGLEVDVKDERGATPMHWVTGNSISPVETMIWLKDNGADLNARNNNGETPLDLAKSYNNLDVAKWLEEIISVSVSPASETVAMLTLDDQIRAVLSLPRDVFKLVAIEGTDLLWIAVTEGGGEKYGLVDGVYIFDERGVFYLRHLTTRCDDLVLSPESKVVALAEDSPAARSWYFYTWADMEPLGGVSCPLADPKLFWAGEDTGVVYTTLESGDYGRTHGDEPRAPRSVAHFDFAKKEERILLRGTFRYDYRVRGVADQDVQAEKASAEGAEPIPGLDVPFLEKVSARLPLAGCPELPLHFDLAAEGRFSGMNEGDDIQAFIEMLPSTLGESVFLSLSVQDSDNFAVFMAMPSEGRVRVVYDMVQQWDARAGKRVVSAVVRTVEPMPDNDPRG